MPRNRMKNRLRKNEDFKVVIRICKEYGLEFDVLHPTGKGHPKLVVYKNGKTALKRPLARTPGHVRPNDVRQRFLSELREKGLIK